MTTWCVHCGKVVEPCTCTSCHRKAMVGQKRIVVIAGIYYGEDVGRDDRWMHERCVGQRLVMSKSGRELPYHPAPTPSQPACVINLSTPVEPARIIQLPPMVVSPAMLRAKGPYRSVC